MGTVGKTSRARRIVTPVIAAGACLAAIWGTTPLAQAEEPDATSYDFQGVVGNDGILDATTVITYDDAPDELEQRLALRESIDANSAYIYEISDVTATIDGAATEVTTKTDGDYLVVTVDTSAADAKPVELHYTVRGATHEETGGTGDLTVVRWRALQGLSTGVREVTGGMRVPALGQLVDCVAGPPGSVAKCTMYSMGSSQGGYPMFEASARGAGEMVTFSVGVDSDAMADTSVVDQAWTLDRAFTVDPLRILTALALLLLGLAGLYFLFRRTGLDRSFEGEGTRVATFRPVADGYSVFEVEDGVRPGEVGTLADERVDPVDITATLLDLAVRGHLHITELPRAPHALQDWQLTRTEGGQGDLLAYEQRFLEAVAPVGGSTLVSQLPSTLAPALAGIQNDLYDEVVRRGWFDSRPDSTRNTWRTIGLVGLAAAAALTFVLVAFTTWGLVALVLLILAAVLYWVADRMPRRSSAGSRLLTGLSALAANLGIHPTDRMPPGHEVAEISKLLPYAVVLGGKDRWLAAMVAADESPTTPDPHTIDWYHAPESWHLQDLPASLTQFITTVQGELYGR